MLSSPTTSSTKLINNLFLKIDGNPIKLLPNINPNQTVLEFKTILENKFNLKKDSYYLMRGPNILSNNKETLAHYYIEEGRTINVIFHPPRS